jgi:hypothetical protein
MTVITATREADTMTSEVQGEAGQLSETTSQKKKMGCVAQWSLCSIPSVCINISIIPQKNPTPNQQSLTIPLTVLNN